MKCNYRRNGDIGFAHLSDKATLNRSLTDSPLFLLRPNLTSRRSRFKILVYVYMGKAETQAGRASQQYASGLWRGISTIPKSASPNQLCVYDSGSLLRGPIASFSKIDDLAFFVTASRLDKQTALSRPRKLTRRPMRAPPELPVTKDSANVP